MNPPRNTAAEPAERRVPDPENRDASAPADDRVVSVLLPIAGAGPYDYRLTEPAPDGSIVRVPLGPRTVSGVIWGAGSGEVAPARIKNVEAVLPIPPFDCGFRGFLDWLAAYCMAPPGAVLRMALSVPAALEPPSVTHVLVRGHAPPRRLSPQRAAVLAALDSGPPATQAALARRASVSAGVVRGLVRAGILRETATNKGGAADWPTPDPARPGLSLSPAQTAAAETLRDTVGRGFSVTLLDGVTGSGKTEVYFEAIADALRNRRQTLVLLPEIALGAQWLARFERRFGARPAAWHSDLTPRQRRETWRAVSRRHAQVVVGARSALFLPFPALGLIVVDEEHDASFKQEEGVNYNARDMAVVRARFADAPIILSSATPSLETLNNAAEGRYRTVSLPRRHGPAALPAIAALDLRADSPPRGRFIAPGLQTALAETFTAGEQAMLFLNRRGYAPLTLCRACGKRLECTNCAAWLVEHRLAGELRCHHCDFRRPFPRICAQCGAENHFAACGPGVERLAEEAAELFPEARMATMTSDTVHGPDAAAKLAADMVEHRIDLLIGTQMAAKGHHFPALTLVGVVDADLGLSGGDLRAAERTFQLLFQVAGRAGRTTRPGRALLQTSAPEHPVIRALIAGDRDGFTAAEMAARRAAGMPPFGRLAAIIVSATNIGAARTAAAELARRAPRQPDLTVLGPAPAPLPLVRGRHRFRLLVHRPHRRGRPLNTSLRPWLAATPPPPGVRVQVDIDPYSFL